MQSVFITGTDTGVGKTVLAATLLYLARERGLDVVPMKPVQTGCEVRNGQLLAPDLERCLSAGGLDPLPPEKEDLVPYRFEPACSPHLAARQAGTRISLEYIETAYGRLAAAHDAVIVEGAGGVLVPLDDERTMLDLMARLRLPVLLAARPRLGTLNHTLLSLKELRRAGLHILAVVFVESDPAEWSDIEEDNRSTITRFGDVPVMGPLPFTENLDNGRNAIATLARTCADELSFLVYSDTRP